MVDHSNPDEDVPSPIDLRTEADARGWVEAADRDRPWREALRLRFAELVRTLPRDAHVLELGAGPGLLAERVLEHCPNVETYTLLDFSEPMLEMSRRRLMRFPAAHFTLADFRSDRWLTAVRQPCSAVLAMQAVHEVRHKRHVPRLYGQIRNLLAPGGWLLVCDHAPKDGSLRWTSLHMTPQEQQQALVGEGYTEVRIDRKIKRLYLVVGRRAAGDAGGRTVL